MQIFIGKIPSRVSEKQIEDYFSQFGKVTNVSLKGTYGFLSFEYDKSIDEVLNQRSHAIDGAPISVERAKGGKRLLDGEYGDRYMDGGRGGYMSPHRDRRGYDYRYSPYPPSMYGSRSPGRYDPRIPDRYGGRTPPDYYRDSFRAGDFRRDREYCDYCNGCPVHGMRDMGFDSRKRHQVARDHPNNHLKVVFENIPPNTSIEDFKGFVREHGFEPSYGRMGYSGTHAILEFKTIEDKDNAMKKFDGLKFTSSGGEGVEGETRELGTRSYLPKGKYRDRERDRGEPQVTEEGLAGPQNEGGGIYEGIEETKTEN